MIGNKHVSTHPQSCFSISVPYLSFRKPSCQPPHPPPPFHPCSLMYILFPASPRADPSAVVALTPPAPAPSRPPSNQLPVLYHGGHPSLPTYLRRSQPMRAEGMVSKHQWGNFFMCIKLFRTLCWVALSVSPGLREESNSPERERERESVRGLRESECERRGGCHFFFLNPNLQGSGG